MGRNKAEQVGTKRSPSEKVGETWIMYNKGGQQSGEYSLLPTCHYLTVGEIANFTGFRYETVRRWLKMGLLEGKLIQKRWRVSRTVFVQFWEGKRVREDVNRDSFD